MQGVIIASADTAVRRSLAAILQGGRTLHECSTVSECLALAAAHKMDYVFIDDHLADGNAEDLARRLNSLGYGMEIVPILLSADRLYLQPFLPHGVRFCIAKPFDVRQIEDLITQVEQIVCLREPPSGLPGEVSPLAESERPASQANGDSTPPPDLDVREVSQRFRRLLAQSLSQEELVHTFVESMQEQFDVDNVVVLFPAPGEPAFRVFTGNITDQVKQQFFIPFDDPLIACLLRLGEPVWVHDHDRLGRANAVTAQRYGERLGVQVLCPVLSRGRALALVGLSRFHRFGNSPVLLSLLRLFFTFFSKALENAELFEKASQARETYRSMVDALPLGFIAVSPAGCVSHVNPAAAALLNIAAEELLDQPVERAGSLVADAARHVLHNGTRAEPRVLPLLSPPLTVSAFPATFEKRAGALLILQRVQPPVAPETLDARAAASQEELWRNMASSVAHNFKNAMVPVKTCAELLPERFQSESFRNGFFEIVTTSINRIDEWIEKLLRFSELQHAPEQLEVFPLHESLEVGIERAMRQVPELKVDMSREFDDEDLVKGARAHFDQLFFELMQNALDEVQDVTAPRIRLRTQVVAETVRAAVEDNGRGMDEAVKATAFAPFMSRKGRGLGLGLAYTQRVAVLHGGHLEILPLAGGGTSVQITLPAAERTPVAVPGK